MATSYNSSEIVRPLVAQNPRKIGTDGYDAFKILLSVPVGTLTYGEYIKLGGRKVDLDWDRARGWAQLGAETVEEAYAAVPKHSRAGLIKKVGVPAGPKATAFDLAIVAALAASEAEPTVPTEAEAMAASVDARLEAAAEAPKAKRVRVKKAA